MEHISAEIRKSRLFRDVSDEEIAAFIRRHPCRIVDHHKRDCIIMREEVSERIGVVLEGTLGIYSDSQYGGHTLIGLSSRHYLFGFVALFYNEGHSITSLYCREFCRIAYFDIPAGETAVDFIRATPPQILSNIYAMLTTHIRDDFDRQHIIHSNSVPVRIARYLLYRQMETGKTTFDLRMNRTELANFLGVYRTSLSRELRRMTERGLIACRGSEVTIKNLPALIDLEVNSCE